MTLRFVPKPVFDRLLTVDGQPLERAAAFADACRINVLSMISQAGSGHIGTSLSCLDILSLLHLEMLGPGDRFFSSKGHDAPALYAVLAATGRVEFNALHRLRRANGLPGHPDLKSTPAVVTNTGSLGMGISKAKGFLRADEVLGRSGRIFVLTGDGELQEGQIWESLGSAANDGLGNLWAIVDHNKLQSDTWVTDVNDLGDVEAKFAAFGWAVERCDGNDMMSLRDGFARLAQAGQDRPKVLVADTVKASGADGMEPTLLGHGPDALYGYHSGAPSADGYERAVLNLERLLRERLVTLGAPPLELFDVPREPSATQPLGDVQRLIAAYGRALVEEAERDPRLVALDADLVVDTGLVPFKKRFPDRFVECGIAEQDMVSQAGAMAIGGLIPVAHSFACFLSTRPNEQIFNNATEGTRVIYTGSLAGVVPGGPGHSHQSVRDISALGGVPNLDLIEPSSESGVAAAVRWAVREADGSVYIRLVSVPWQLPYDVPAASPLERGCGWIVRRGSQIVLIAAGPVLLSQAWHAAEALASEGLDVGVVELPWLRHIDPVWLANALGTQLTVCLDNHFIAGGQGEACLSALASAPQAHLGRVALHGMNDIPICGTNSEVLAHHALDSAGIAQRIRGELALLS